MTGFSNTFHGDVEKAVQIGAVHVHAGESAPIPPPWQVPAELPHYTNHHGPRADLAAVLAPADCDGAPRVGVVVGSPGIGKSALATQVANDVGRRFPDGVFVAQLGVADDERLGEQLREWLERTTAAREPIPASLTGRKNLWLSWTHGKSVLVVIDDVVTTAQIEALRPANGRSAVVAVGAQALLGLAADREVTVGKLDGAAATELLAKLAPGSDLRSDAEALATVLRRCDGSAAALNIAGSLLGEMSLSRLARKLADPERGWAGMRQVFDTAYNRFEDDVVRRCYRLFGIHPSGAGVTSEAVAAVLDVHVDDADDALRALKRAALVTEIADDRYELASRELMAAHAAGLLDDEERDIRTADLVRYYTRHAMACARAWMPKRTWPENLWGDDLPAPLDDADVAREWLRTERRTLRAVADLAYRLGSHDVVCRMAIALWPLHDKDKYTYDQVAVGEIAAAAADELAFPVAASILRQQWAFGLRDLGRFDDAADLLVTAIRNAEQTESDEALNSGKEALGLLRRAQGRIEPARQLLDENYVYAKDKAEPERLALATFHHATVLADIDQALELLGEARAYFAAKPDPDNVLKVDLWCAKRRIEKADAEALAEAETGLQDVVTRAKDAGPQDILVEAYAALADLAQVRGDAGIAHRRLTNALEIAERCGFARLHSDLTDRLARVSP
ncbi:hypothetical protein BJF85_14595 [Saccharomonospora sp. CUA-673]|uniref:NB-ARC domain-containing protein n=1 Tax=Saccharomonospora sp. CUA-673 TaxID=1904969 RepID=UPI0009675A1F|nr:NB-ARC domain-containing protein [Saccharomonospora sp. CUA-673]OLT47852.1 hypothetical protein BJF85_14595 [Saccharomonospora sp. CUA-673]